MRLSKQQRKILQEALIDAFPNTASLEQMLSFELNQNLRAITGEGSLQDIVFKLIQAAESQGWVEDLICAACNCNSGNFKLDSIVQNLIVKNSSTLYNIIEELLRQREYFDLDELGSGVIGVTYRARKNGQPCVIKTIKMDLLYKIIKSANQNLKEFNLEREIKNITKEAETLSSFKHPHIVSYNNHFTIKYKFLIKNPDKKPDNNSYLVYNLELLFLIMEYIEGETLEQLLNRRDTSLEEKEALGYIQQIGQALTFVHGKGVLHRDIKPPNIMVLKTTNDAVLIDFGIARDFDSKVTQTHTVAFTQGYAPPEQLEERYKRGSYTDVYGLAATLYYLLTKVHPTHASTRKSDSSSFSEPKKFNPNISDSVNDAILKGMELEPSKRPQTVQQWLKELFSENPIELKQQQQEAEKLQRQQEAEILRKEQEKAEYQTKLQRYEQELSKAVNLAYPLDEYARNGLKSFQQSLGILDEDVALIEQSVIAPKEAEYRRQLETERLKRQQEAQRQQHEVIEFELRSTVKNEQAKLDDDLSSARNVDYTKLRDFLKKQQWKEADEETLAVMLKASGREKEGGWLSDSLSSESIKNFPCTDLRTIDKLWVKYSSGRFGFSVQKRIWESVGKDRDKFGEAIGWIKGRDWIGKNWIKPYEITFDTKAPPGYLPVVMWVLDDKRWRLYPMGGTFDLGVTGLRPLVEHDGHLCSLLSRPDL
jgi:eukaryotic-like serine/threonine-protein kinase